MARSGRGAGGKGVGGTPSTVPSALRVTCPVCDAMSGARCRVWRMAGGVRLYVRGYRVKPHPERVAAARA